MDIWIIISLIGFFVCLSFLSADDVVVAVFYWGMALGLMLGTVILLIARLI